MILCITLNPVVDTTYFVDRVRPVYRTVASRVTHLMGGKSSNVVRALGSLNEDGHTLLCLGGKMGHFAARVIDEEDLPCSIAWVSDETRLMITIVDADHQQQAFFAPNGPFTDEDAASVLAAVEELLPQAEILAVCGSSPARRADELFRQILEQAKRRAVPTLLDSSGGGLARGLEAGPTIVKVNLAEAEGVLGRELPDMGDRIAALQHLRSHGTRWAIITMGADGALMSPESGEFWHVLPPDLQAINPIGSGDAMAAGLLAAFRRGFTAAECVRYATAVAAANTLTWDACDINVQDVDRLLPQVQLLSIT